MDVTFFPRLHTVIINILTSLFSDSCVLSVERISCAVSIEHTKPFFDGSRTGNLPVVGHFTTPLSHLIMDDGM